MSPGAQKLYGLINYSNQRKRNYLSEGLLVSLSFVVLKGMICIREKTVSLLLEYNSFKLITRKEDLTDSEFTTRLN